jgi:hypothetical protein
MISAWTRSQQERRAERERDFATKHLARGTVGVVFAVFPLPPDFDAARIGKDAVLFLRCGQNLRCAMQAMQDMGFKYKSCCVVRENGALLLVGTRGKIPAPASGTQFSSLIAENAIRKMIGCYFPNTPTIEVAA